jgi:hypothetical protein
MIEVVYCPVNNEIFIFTGCFDLDVQTKTIRAYLQTKRKGIKIAEASQLVHIGWL